MAVDFQSMHMSRQVVAFVPRAPACLEVGDLLSPLLCCKRPNSVHVSSTCGASHPFPGAVNSILDRCAILVMLCRTADIFLSRGTEKRYSTLTPKLQQSNLSSQSNSAAQFYWSRSGKHKLCAKVCSADTRV